MNPDIAWFHINSDWAYCCMGCRRVGFHPFLAWASVEDIEYAMRYSLSRHCLCGMYEIDIVTGKVIEDPSATLREL